MYETKVFPTIINDTTTKGNGQGVAYPQRYGFFSMIKYLNNFILMHYGTEYLLVSPITNRIRYFT